MMSPVTKAMVEAYALMIMVMGTFFIYFCGMVWAFCNPMLSGGEEEEEDGLNDGTEDDGAKSNAWTQMVPNPQQEILCTGAHPPETQQQHTKDWLAQTTYINFGGDTDSLLLDRNDFGFAEQVRESKTWGSPV